MEQQLSGFVGSRYVVCYEFINYSNIKLEQLYLGTILTLLFTNDLCLEVRYGNL